MYRPLRARARCRLSESIANLFPYQPAISIHFKPIYLLRSMYCFAHAPSHPTAGEHRLRRPAVTCWTSSHAKKDISSFRESGKKAAGRTTPPSQDVYVGILFVAYTHAPLSLLQPGLPHRLAYLPLSTYPVTRALPSKRPSLIRVRTYVRRERKGHPGGRRQGGFCLHTIP